MVGQLCGGAVSLALLRPDLPLFQIHAAHRRKSGLALLPRSALSGLGAPRNTIPWRLADRTGRWYFGRKLAEFHRRPASGSPDRRLGIRRRSTSTLREFRSQASE